MCQSTDARKPALLKVHVGRLLSCGGWLIRIGQRGRRCCRCGGGGGAHGIHPPWIRFRKGQGNTGRNSADERAQTGASRRLLPKVPCTGTLDLHLPSAACLFDSQVCLAGSFEVDLVDDNLMLWEVTLFDWVFDPSSALHRDLAALSSAKSDLMAVTLRMHFPHDFPCVATTLRREAGVSRLTHRSQPTLDQARSIKQPSTATPFPQVRSPAGLHCAARPALGACVRRRAVHGDARGLAAPVW